MEKLETGNILFEMKKNDSEDTMWEDILNVTRILVKHGYECNITDEDCGIVSLTYCDSTYYANEYGSPRFEILTAEESEELRSNRQHVEEEDC